MNAAPLTTVWIVDYDQPDDPAARMRFYRALWKITGKRGGHSTQSVLYFRDRKTAQRVYELASREGQANLWEARRAC
jgi:hypothetical protein